MVPSNGEPQIFQVVRGKIPPAMKMALSLGDFNKGFFKGILQGSLNGTYFWGSNNVNTVYGNFEGKSLIKVHCLVW